MANTTVSAGMLATLGQVAFDAGDDASGRLSLVILALVILAAVIAVATVVFWLLTRPEPIQERTSLLWEPPDGQSIRPPDPVGPPSGGDPVDVSRPEVRRGPAAPGGPPGAG